jgi:hypothetical protein
MIKYTELILGEYYIDKDGIILKYLGARLAENDDYSILKFYPIIEKQDGYVSYLIKLDSNLVNIYPLPDLLRELL